MKIEFTVQNIPPKKDGANSMWLKDSEAPRILSLRKAALDAMKKAGLKACIDSPVKLEVTVLAPSSQFIRNSGNYIGDLDTLVAGICDGLQAAHSNTPIAHALFQNLQTPEIHPNHKLLLIPSCDLSEKYERMRKQNGCTGSRRITWPESRELLLISQQRTSKRD